MNDKENDKQQKKPSKVHKHFPRKRLLIIVAIIVFLVGGAVGGWLIVSNKIDVFSEISILLGQKTKSSKKPTMVTPEQIDKWVGEQATQADIDYAKSQKDKNDK